MPKFRTVGRDAIRLTTEMTIKNPNKSISKGAPGDWLITEQGGRQFFMKDSKFREEYIPLNDEAKAYLELYGE